MSGSRGPLLFVAVNAVGDREHQRSIRVADALIKAGQNAIVLASLDKVGTMVATESWVVPLFDDNYNVNRWSPRPIDTWWTPDWVRKLSSSRWCVAVGKVCITLPPETMEKLACQMARRFSLGDVIEGREQEESKWGPLPAAKKADIIIGGRRLPSHGWSQGRIG